MTFVRRVCVAIQYEAWLLFKANFFREEYHETISSQSSMRPGCFLKTNTFGDTGHSLFVAIQYEAWLLFKVTGESNRTNQDWKCRNPV